MQYRILLFAAAAALAAGGSSACQKWNVPGEDLAPEQHSYVSLPDVARLLASVPLEVSHLEEVHGAASASSANGYDEEYRMRDLFESPGAGVGGSAPAKAYARPLRDLLREAFLSTKAGGSAGEAWLDSLALSDVQIYWPYAARWDGSSLPVITYDPGEGALTGEGWALQRDGSVQKVLVAETLAQESPVWVVNRNRDAQYKSLEMLRREDPSWGSGGGSILVKSPTENCHTLVLRSIRTYRQFDSWFAGGSEFFIKMGAVEDFIASTEAELRLYDPTITDFMVVVRRSQMGEEVPFNAVLVSEWTSQLSACALMVVDDDGGTRTSWKCSAVVKVASKSYGVEMEIPLHSRDDIVWRGSLSRAFIERNNGTPVRLGDVDLVLELI